MALLWGRSYRADNVMDHCLDGWGAEGRMLRWVLDHRRGWWEVVGGWKTEKDTETEDSDAQARGASVGDRPVNLHVRHLMISPEGCIHAVECVHTLHNGPHRNYMWKKPCLTLFCWFIKDCIFYFIFLYIETFDYHPMCPPYYMYDDSFWFSCFLFSLKLEKSEMHRNDCQWEQKCE